MRCVYRSIKIMDIKKEERSGERGSGGGGGVKELTVEPYVNKSEVASIKVVIIGTKQ